MDIGSTSARDAARDGARDRRRDEKRERILAGAIEAFAAHGFHRAQIGRAHV